MQDVLCVLLECVRMRIIYDNEKVIDIAGYPDKYPFDNKERDIDLLNRIYT